ncbi:hypothetical protein HGRIS_008890 [Hohenbuehelia grisea]|uniref:Aldehyde dehydrogenase domain-containing protein n=1 Tax=Hohenbuehelia grisea TaxID=104357 RepID=A0ABR3IZM2_9AGAR
MASFTHQFDTPVYKGSASIDTRLFIDGKFVDPVEGGSIEVVNPTNGKIITSVAAGTSKDVDIAVQAARKAYKTSWGLRVPGKARGQILNKIADLIEKHGDELAALECLNTGKIYTFTHFRDIPIAVETFRYYAGWADKIHGQTIETDENKLAYTRHEPYGVVAQIVPWNFPLVCLAAKVAPALATGNVIVFKPSEVTPLTALKFASFLNEAGVPPGVVNVINGYGHTVGQAFSSHPQIEKLAFTGSTLTGRKILEASARTNLKDVTLELGGKSPNIIFDDCDLEQAVKWSTMGIFFNMGQVCIAGSRIFVQEGVYERFVGAFQAAAKGFGQAAGDPFAPQSQHGPQVSKSHFERIMSYIDSGKQEGATVLAGGQQHGDTGYYIEPTLFTDVTPEMKIAREEIFGPVAVIIKFKDEAEVIEMANDTSYGLACGVFTENTSRALRVIHALEAGSAFVNCYSTIEVSVPFGGHKQSGIGKESGEAALATYTQVKAVHVNIGMRL